MTHWEPSLPPMFESMHIIALYRALPATRSLRFLKVSRSWFLIQYDYCGPSWSDESSLCPLLLRLSQRTWLLWIELSQLNVVLSPWLLRRGVSRSWSSMIWANECTWLLWIERSQLHVLSPLLLRVSRSWSSMQTMRHRCNQWSLLSLVLVLVYHLQEKLFCRLKGCGMFQ